MSDAREEIGRRITLARGVSGQGEFAKKLGVHKNTLGNYERGLRSPDCEFLLQLEGLGFNSRWVVTGIGDMHGTESEHKPEESTRRSSVDAQLFQSILQDRVDLRALGLSAALSEQLIESVMDVVAHYNDVAAAPESEREILAYININEEQRRMLTKILSTSLKSVAKSDEDYQEQVGRYQKAIRNLEVEYDKMKSKLEVIREGHSRYDPSE